MGRFSTKNSDGASGLGEPVNTIPAKAQRLMKGEADRHSCDSLAEFYTAGPKSPNDFDPTRADRN